MSKLVFKEGEPVTIWHPNYGVIHEYFHKYDEGSERGRAWLHDDDGWQTGYRCVNTSMIHRGHIKNPGKYGPEDTK